MTHTLHRLGSEESLRDDYIVFRMHAWEVNKWRWNQLRSFKFRLKTIIKRAFNKFFGYVPVARVVIKRIAFGLRKAPIVGGLAERVLPLTIDLWEIPIFNTKEDLTIYLKELKEEDLGLSVIVNGLFDEINACIKEVGLRPHTVQFSLGIFGKTEKLPQESILELTTMCGHHMISPRLVEKLIADVNKGDISVEGAARIMWKQCYLCHSFNKTRAIRLIKALTK